jgi:hypothetical protein
VITVGVHVHGGEVPSRHLHLSCLILVSHHDSVLHASARRGFVDSAITRASHGGKSQQQAHVKQVKAVSASGLVNVRRMNRIRVKLHSGRLIDAS